MIRRWRWTARLPMVLLWSGITMTAPVSTVPAEVDLRPGIIGTDDRAILTESGPPWEAVGQVNVGGFRTAGQCTGTLIAPDIVITAAHCLVNAATGRPFPLADIHFLAAVRGSDHKGHSAARCLRFAPDREGLDAAPPSNPRLSEVARDAAVIVLNENIAAKPVELAANTGAAPGLWLAHVAYPGDRRYAPVIHEGCRLLAGPRDGPIWFNDCDTQPGGSGGPVFVEEDGAHKLAAIQVAAGSRGANLALPAAVWAGLASDASCP